MKRPLIAAIVLALFASINSTPCRAGDPYAAGYHWSANRTFWFMVISDIHIGESSDQDTKYLTWAVTDARDIINPNFIVATGDLTDSTNGTVLGIFFGPYPEEWQAYRQILLNAGIENIEDFFFDLPGNHDHYNDQPFELYRQYSIQGAAHDTTQHAWTRVFPFGTYQFIGTNTAGNDGARFSLSEADNFGDHAGLDNGELDFIEAALMAGPNAKLTLIFGHHPFEADYYVNTDTGLTYGLTGLLDLIDFYGVSAYTFGHTHNYRENFYTSTLDPGVFYLNVSSLGKAGSDHFAVTAVDGNGLSIVPGQKGLWPVVLITAPVDRDLGILSQPFGYDVPQGKANPIRALVFDHEGAIASVEYRIDGSATWHPMQPVAGSPVWRGFWDATSTTTGFHQVEVRAQGTTTVTDSVTTYVNPAACLGDSEKDGDVDGKDLAEFIADFVPQTLEDVAASFGKKDCSL